MSLLYNIRLSSTFDRYRSADDDLDLDHLTDGVQLGSSSEVLSHLPTYQHKAVLDIREELNWMLMDEIAFALSRGVMYNIMFLIFFWKSYSY